MGVEEVVREVEDDTLGAGKAKREAEVSIAPKSAISSWPSGFRQRYNSAYILRNSGSEKAPARPRMCTKSKD